MRWRGKGTARRGRRGGGEKEGGGRREGGRRRREEGRVSLGFKRRRRGKSLGMWEESNAQREERWRRKDWTNLARKGGHLCLRRL